MMVMAPCRRRARKLNGNRFRRIHRLGCKKGQGPHLAGGLGEGQGHGVGAGGELVKLEHAHGAVPDDGLAVRQLLRGTCQHQTGGGEGVQGAFEASDRAPSG